MLHAALWKKYQSKIDKEFGFLDVCGGAAHIQKTAFL
jgi:hypothetical protein